MRAGANKRWFVIVLALAVLTGLMLCAIQPARADVFDKVVKSSSDDGSYIKDNPFTDSEKLSLGKTVDKTQEILTTVTAICILISFGFFIWNVAKAGTSGGNDKKLSEAKQGLLWSGISLSLFGSLFTVVRFFWYLLAPA